MKATLILDTKSQLGEGPIWHHELKQLYFVDIEGRQLHLYTPEVDELRSFPTGERVGTVVPVESGGALVALQNGIFHMDLTNGDTTLLANPISQARDIRFNDGKCDPLGRFWVGTMHLDEKEGAASLFVMNEKHEVRKVLEDLTISNGLIWSLDQNTFYFIDTPTGEIQAFSYDVASGEISSPKVVVTIPEDMGSPDGMTIDEEGMLWVALFGGGAVVRYNPDNGELMQKIEVDAPNVTACAFGGESLDTLYITTARQGMDEEAQRKYPEAGGLFAVAPGARGVPAHFYKDTTIMEQ